MGPTARRPRLTRKSGQILARPFRGRVRPRPQVARRLKRRRVATAGRLTFAAPATAQRPDLSRRRLSLRDSGRRKVAPRPLS